MKKIIVYCETNYSDNTLENASFELLSKARELKLNAKFLSDTTNVNLDDADYMIEAVTFAKELSKNDILKAVQAGADKVILLKNEIADSFVHTDIARVFVEYFKKNPSEIIIFPASQKGRIIAPRITTMLNTGLVADCTGLEFALKKNELKLAPTRPTFGSELMATILSKKNPQCATIRPSVFKAEYSDIKDFKENQFEIIETQGPKDNQKIKFFSLIKENSEDKIDFSKEKIILAGGFGLCNGKNKEYIEKLKILADKLGAQFATTRKVVEFGLEDKKYQIGQTGSSVEANIYIAFGISGAIQHIQGMKNSKIIIGVNIDENADIFNYCDYKVVDDAKKIIDEMLTIV